MKLIGVITYYINLVINLQLTKKVPVIFHNLKGYDNHSTFNELKKLDAKINVIPNGLEKCVAFILNKNLVFIDSTQSMNSNLEKPVKNLSHSDFKYLTQDFRSKKLEFFKKRCLAIWIHKQFKRFSEK